MPWFISSASYASVRTKCSVVFQARVSALRWASVSKTRLRSQTSHQYPASLIEGGRRCGGCGFVTGPERGLIPVKKGVQRDQINRRIQQLPRRNERANP